MGKNVLVAMSGGVDSSVAAILLMELGYSCTGVTMKLYDNEEIGQKESRTCCTLNDIEDARLAALKIGISHYVFNFKNEFRKSVIENFVKEYEIGNTPNPCIDCNKYLKFGKFLERAKKLGYEYVATGHYARIIYNNSTERYELHRARDITKDQSYVLYQLTQEQLAHICFPLGNYMKSDIRKIAEKYGLENSNKPDSQDICFVPDGRYADFILRYTQKDYPCGNFIGPNNEILGKHKGIINYTIGQRKGLELSLPQPLYVKEIDTASNDIKLCRDKDLFSKELDANNINLISVKEIKKPIRLTVKIRYNQKAASAVVYQTTKDTFHVCFYEPQRATTKGQSVVLYDNDNVVGGGIINKTYI